MATREIYSTDRNEQQLEPPPEVESIALPESPPVPAINFVKEGLAFSVKHGKYDKMKATKQLNSWDPEHPVNPGFFR